MKRHALLLLLFLISIAGTRADIDRSISKSDEEIDRQFGSAVEFQGAAAQRRSLAKWKPRIEECRNMPGSEAIPILGQMAHKLAHTRAYQVPERLEIYDLARDILISIPGHAEYYGKEIKRLTDDEFAGRLKEHPSTRGWHFQTLRELPSPETVRVLGELLFDERDLDGDEPTDSPWTPNSVKAAYTFHDLGLKNPPVAARHGDAWLDLPTWRLWYQQVRAGTRTFSFKGEDTVYSLDGPVPAPSGSNEPRKNAAVSGVVGPAKSDKPSKMPLVVALVLLVVSIIVAVSARLRWKPSAGNDK